jgi:antitoxin component YwqK of YwqJK toxin-antitoxin module
MIAYFKINKDTVVKNYYYKNKSIKWKRYYLVNESESDGYYYPIKYYDPILLKQEYYCQNELLQKQINDYKTEKDKKNYYCNGNTKSYIEEYYKQMKLVGKFIYYYENGKINYKGQFKEHEENEPQNVSVKVGEWIFYDINGDVEKVELFDENGEEIKREK